jgi:hypothetical protein
MLGPTPADSDLSERYIHTHTCIGKFSYSTPFFKSLPKERRPELKLKCPFLARSIWPERAISDLRIIDNSYRAGSKQFFVQRVSV